MKYFAKLSFIIIAFTCLTTGVKAQTILDRDSLVADFHRFANYLEETHPDPYSGFGGKVFFHIKAAELEESLKNNPYTKEDFETALASFISNLNDGHTWINSDPAKSDTRYTPIWFNVITDGLIVSAVSSDYSDLLGCRLDSVNGVPVEKMLEKVSRYYQCENEYGRYHYLTYDLNNESNLKRLGCPVENGITYSMHTPDGKIISRSFPLISSDEINKIKKVFPPEYGNYPDEYLYNCFADEDKSTMLLRMKSIMSRESFEYMYYNGWDTYGSLCAFYERIVKKEMPSDTLEAITALPDFSVMFADMLKDMKKHHTKDLIIDLRNNGGGWTPIVMSTLYMLYGDKALTVTDDCRFYVMVSPLYMQKMNTTLEDWNRANGSHFKYGDYLLEEGGGSNPLPIEEMRGNFIKYCMASDEVKDMMRKQKGKPIYTPENVYVITSALTFSAAFHYTFYLWKLGAKTVGVPSCQAPNTFMEVTPFQLPYSKVSGSISNSMQIFLPYDDPRAKTLYPDIMMKYDDYKKYGFDRNSEVRYILEH